MAETTANHGILSKTAAIFRLNRLPFEEMPGISRTFF